MPIEDEPYASARSPWEGRKSANGALSTLERSMYHKGTYVFPSEGSSTEQVSRLVAIHDFIGWCLDSLDVSEGHVFNGAEQWQSVSGNVALMLLRIDEDVQSVGRAVQALLVTYELERWPVYHRRVQGHSLETLLLAVVMRSSLGQSLACRVDECAWTSWFTGLLKRGRVPARFVVSEVAPGSASGQVGDSCE